MSDRLVKFFAAFVFVFLSMPVSAQVHRCVIDGRTVFSDQPCPDAAPTIGQQAEQLRQQREAEAARQAAESAECAAWMATPPTVTNSPWDSSVYQVEEWLERAVRNPRSLEYVAWSSVLRRCDGYSVFVRYRATNGFGAIVTESMRFRFDRSGAVISADQSSWNP